MGGRLPADLAGVHAHADRRQHTGGEDQCKCDQVFKGGWVDGHHGSRRNSPHGIARAERHIAAVLEEVICVYFPFESKAVDKDCFPIIGANRLLCENILKTYILFGKYRPTGGRHVERSCFHDEA